MRKKIMVASMLVILLTISIVGCNKVSEAKKNVDEFKGTITVWSTGEKAKALRIAGDNFTQKYKGVKVIVTEMQGEELYGKLNTNLQSGAELPNLVSVDGGMVASLVNKFPNKFLDLTNDVSSIKDKFLKSKLDEVTLDGKIMALPWEAAPSALFYRSDILESMGIKAEDIKTWDDYIEAGKKINLLSKGKIKMLPIEDKKDDFLYSQFLSQLGNWYFDKAGKPILSSEDSLKAMSMIKEIYNSNIALSCGDVDSIIIAAKAGKIATVPYGANFVATIMENCPDGKGKWAVMKLPSFEPGGKRASTLDGAAIMVSAVPENQKLISEFAKFSVTDSETLLQGISKNAIFPSYTPIYDDLLFQASEDYFGGEKIWRLFSIIAKDSISRNFTKNYLEGSENMKKVEVNIIKGEDIKKALDDAQLNALKIFSK